MASERIQRQVDRLLDEAAEAVGQGDWALVRDCSQRALVVDPGNQEALSFMAYALYPLYITHSSGNPGFSLP